MTSGRLAQWGSALLPVLSDPALAELVETLEEAEHLAELGRRRDGYRLVVAGLEKAYLAEARGEAEGTNLVRWWTVAIDAYLSDNAVPQG
jgi:hypothetical protein